MLGLTEYIIAARGPHWPADEGLISAAAGREPAAAVRTEPWPEVRTRPWPDGAVSRPWLMWLLGVGRDPDPSRTVVRRLADGRPLARLHRRAPLFSQTVGVFDGDDVRVGYCRWGFKGTGPRGSFAVARADHSPACAVERAGAAEFRVTGAGGAVWAAVTVLGRGPAGACRVSVAGPDPTAGPDGVLLLAAAVVLFGQECVGPAAPDAAADRGGIGGS